MAKIVSYISEEWMLQNFHKIEEEEEDIGESTVFSLN